MSIKSASHSSITKGSKTSSLSSGLGTYSNPATSATELYNSGMRTDGPYWIRANSSAPLQQIYCILDSAWGNGWMVVAHNSASTPVYASKHVPRLTSRKSFVGSNGPNSYDFNYNWSIDMSGIYFTELAWVGYAGATATLTSYSLTSKILTVNTTAPHGFKNYSPVVLVTGNATIDAGDRVIYDIPSATSFRCLLDAANISLTSNSTTVYGVSNSRDIKNTVATHMYGTFNSPTYIPSSKTYMRVFDNPYRGKFLSFLGASKELMMDTAGTRFWKWIGLYDGLAGTPATVATANQNYTYPITAIGDAFNPENPSYPIANNDSICPGATGIFSFNDRDMVERDANRLSAPYGYENGGGGSIYGLDDFQDGNSLGDGWSTNNLNGLGKGCPSYIMVK